MQNRDNPSTKIYADIEHHKIDGGTIPSNIVPTGQRPDLVIVETLEEGTKISLVELTVPFERNIDAAIKREKSRYTPLQLDIERTGVSCDLMTLEIGCRG